MNRKLILIPLALAPFAANADVPSSAPSNLPPYVRPFQTPAPPAPGPGAVLVPTGPDSAFGGVTVPLPSGGHVDGAATAGPGNAWSVGTSVTLPHDVGGK
jgi:hypothetical protein